jgi:hypothetical protein
MAPKRLDILAVDTCLIRMRPGAREFRVILDDHPDVAVPFRYAIMMAGPGRPSVV